MIVPETPRCVDCTDRGPALNLAGYFVLGGLVKSFHLGKCQHPQPRPLNEQNPAVEAGVPMDQGGDEVVEEIVTPQKDDQPKPTLSSKPSVVVSGRLDCFGIDAGEVSFRLAATAVVRIAPVLTEMTEGGVVFGASMSACQVGRLETKEGALMSFVGGPNQASLTVAGEWMHRGEVAFQGVEVALVDVGTMGHEVGL